MADVNLASLNFKLGIPNEQEFNDKIKAITETAEQMNAKVSDLLGNLNKVSSGRMSQSKKNEMLLGLRNELKEAEADVSRLESKLQSFTNNAKRYGTSPYIVDSAQNKIHQVTEELETARQKVTQLQEAYNKLGGDKALAATFKETKKNASDTSIELLQMREYYKQIASNANSSATAQKKLTDETRKGNSELRGMSRMWRDIKNYTMVYFSFEGARRLVSSLVQVSAEFEKQRISLHAILQDADGAERIFSQIKELAVQSPFQFKELVTYTKQLSAFSIPMNELYDTTKMLADVSAGLGVGMDRLVLAYGQIRSASFLRGQEVRQLTEAGIPILEELRRQFEEMGEIGITAGQVFDKISARQVTFEMVQKVFKNMTSEGGKFYQMQEVLAETLSGKLSNLTDAYQIMFSEIGNKMEGFLKGSVDALRSLAENYEKVGRILVELVAVYGAYKTALTVVRIAEEAAAQAQLALTLGNTLTRAQAAGKAVEVLAGKMSIFSKIGSVVSKINPYAAAAAGAAALIAVIYNIATAETKLDKLQNDVNASVEDYNKKVGEETVKLEYLLGRMQKLEASTKEYSDLKKELLNNYGQYLSDLDREKIAVGDLAGMYDTLAQSIADAQREKSMSEGFSKISEYYTEEYSDAIDRLRGNLKALNIETTGAVAQELSDYLRGEITRADFTDEAAKAYSDMVTKSMASTTRLFGHSFANPEDLKKQISDAKDAVETETENLANSLNVMYGVVQKKGVEALDGWRKSIQDIADEAENAQVALGISIDRQTTLSTVIGDVKEKIKETKQAIADNAGIEEQAADIERQRLAYLERINKVLLGKATADGGGATVKKTEEAGEKRAAIIEKQVEAYKKLKEMYSSLVEYMSDSKAREAMKSFFPSAEGMINDDFDAEIERLTKELMELAQAGDEVAMKLLDSLGHDKFVNLISSLKEAEKATEEYKKLMADWEGLIPDDGTFGKIVSDYQKLLNKIEELRVNSMNALVDEWVKNPNIMSADEFIEQSNVIQGNSIAAQEKALDDAKDKAEKAIEELYRKWRDENLDFENLSDKTIAQLGNLQEAIRNWDLSSLTEEEKGKLTSLMGDMTQLNALIEKVKAGDLGKLKSEEKTKDIRAWKQLADSILDAAKSLKTFAEASDNVALGQVADAITKAGELTKNVLNGFKNADIAGAVVAGVATIADWLLDAATRAAQLKAELAAIAHQGYLEEIDERLKSADTIFGSSLMGHIRGLRNEIRGLGKDINDALSTEFLKSSGKYTGDIFVSLNSELQKYALDLNRALKDANGFFDDTTLEQIDEKYSKDLKKHGLYEAFTNLKDYNEKMKKLYEDLVKSVGDMFDELSSDIADSLIESLKATGSAVTDLEDVFQSLGDSIFKSMVQSYIIDEILSKYKDEVMSWWTDETLSEADIANRIRNFANEVKQEIDLADERLTAMYDAFMENSLLSVSDSAKEKTVGAGIKSITEDTANLLASYVNAIRADVAAIRQAVVAGNTASVPAPTLAEYLTQIQANTYNNAVAAQGILENLQSMMTVTDGPALRVFM